MRVSEVYEAIDARSPFESALSWDNSGLLVGDMEAEVSGVYLAVDATDEVIEAAAARGASLIITHHPMIFTSISRVTEDDMTGRRVLRLVREGISLICMHTNYDIYGMAQEAAKRLGLVDPVVLDVCGSDEDGPFGIGRTGALEKPLSLRDLCEKVKKVFFVDQVRMFGDPDAKVGIAAICPGSGKSVIGEAISQGADVLITGDIDHHNGIDAVMQGISIIDAGHYGIEKLFMEDMFSFLGEAFPELKVYTHPVAQPWEVI